MLRILIYYIFIFFSLSSCSQKKHYTILLENAKGLQKGGDVVLNGICVGHVSKMKLLPDLRIVVSISLDKDFKLPLGSKFLVQTPLIGNTKLIIEKSENSILATKHDTLYGYLDTMNSTSLFHDSAKRKAVNKIIEGFQELMESSKKDTIK